LKNWKIDSKFWKQNVTMWRRSKKAIQVKLEDAEGFRVELLEKKNRKISELEILLEVEQRKNSLKMENQNKKKKSGKFGKRKKIP